jgi:hypothetical protein
MELEKKKVVHITYDHINQRYEGWDGRKVVYTNNLELWEASSNNQNIVYSESNNERRTAH